MIKFLSVVSLLVTFYSSSANACSCRTLGEDFFETVFLHNQKIEMGEWPRTMALSIVTAEVKDYLQLRPGPEPTEMILDVADIIQGSVLSKQLVVQGDDGASCMPYVTQFAKGKKFVFALNQYQGQYYISSCGFYSKEMSRP